MQARTALPTPLGGLGLGTRRGGACAGDRNRVEAAKARAHVLGHGVDSLAHDGGQRARAAVGTQRWSRARFWGEAMAAREPRNSSVILGLAAAMNNLVWSVAEADRGAARTSRDRIALLMNAIALMDSAAALARNEGEWDRALEMKAEALENVGFPTDALAIYEGVMRRSPAFAPPRARAAWVIQRLRGTGR